MFIKKLITRFIKPSIIFESVPDFSDNARMVYDEMVREGYGKRNRLVWFIDWNKCAYLKNGKAVYWSPDDNKTLLQRVRSYSYYKKTKCIITCYRFIPSKGYVSGDGLVSIYLSHGTPMKSVKDYYTSPGKVDYILSPSDNLNEVMAREFSFKIEQVFVAGFPRNDYFANPAFNMKEKIGIKCEKIVAWLPTYRQHFNNGITTSSITLPLIHDNDCAIAINKAAEEAGIIILLKPHPAQDISFIHDLGLSNIKLINEEFLNEHKLNLYELLRNTDALITDYSSVYFDYLLCDRPIGVVWEDIDEYSRFPGFAVDLDYYLKGAEKIFSIDDMIKFLTDIAEGRDGLQKERREIRDYTNISTDGKNTIRVVDFIAKEAALKR